jgi:hypothetical protein
VFLSCGCVGMGTVRGGLGMGEMLGKSAPMCMHRRRASARDMSSVAVDQTPVPSHRERTSTSGVFEYAWPTAVSAAMRSRTFTSRVAVAVLLTRSRKPRTRSPHEMNACAS